MTVLSGVRVVAGDRLIEHGYVRIEGELIADVGEADPGIVHCGLTVVPGFVDIHVHGGGGATFTTGDADAARATAAFHLRHGTTTMLASLVSSPFELMLSATKAFAPLVADGVLAGIHFEGPYLSAVRCGALARTAAARPITPHVRGSSKKPAYRSECTRMTRNTAASPRPNTRSMRTTRASAQATAASTHR